MKIRHPFPFFVFADRIIPAGYLTEQDINVFIFITHFKLFPE